MIELEDIKLVVFDLDDTLYPEYEFAEGGFRNVASFLAGENVPLARQLAEKMKALAQAGRRGAVFQAVLSDLQRPCCQENILDLLRLYRTSNRPLSLFPDADRAVIRFCKGHFFSGILTDGPLESQQAKIRLLKLQPRVDHIVYTAELGPGREKPSPAGFELMMKKFNVQPRQCVYIADNEAKDFYAPNILGWRSVKVLRPEGVYFDAAAISDLYKPQFVIGIFDELNLLS
jgi:putative hydrolase of the HAD superfamily